MSQTRALDTPTATFNRLLYQSYPHGIKEEFAIIGFLMGLYGILTILSLLSVYALVTHIVRILACRCTRKTRFTTITLLLTLFILFAATTTYVVVLILGAQTSFLTYLILPGPMLWLGSNIQGSSVLMDLSQVEDYTSIQYCAGTAALTLNVLPLVTLTCVGEHALYGTKIQPVLLATFVLRAVDTSLIGNSGWTLVYERTKTTGVMVKFLYEGFPAGIAACVISLTSKVLSTLLVGYKAWESRKRLRGYLVAGPRTAQVKKLFALLIESGALYCALWVIFVVIVGFQIGEYRFIETADPRYEEGFFDIVAIVIDGSLVPLIAIYSTVTVIVLVALNRSHMERGLLQFSGSYHEDRSPHRVPEVLFIDEERLGCGDGPRDASPRTSEEVKVGGIV